MPSRKAINGPRGNGMQRARDMSNRGTVAARADFPRCSREVRQTVHLVRKEALIIVLAGGAVECLHSISLVPAATISP